jgi:hypothetical protein
VEDPETKEKLKYVTANRDPGNPYDVVYSCEKATKKGVKVKGPFPRCLPP